MILQQRDLENLEQHWAVAAVRREDRTRAHDVANAWLIEDALGTQLQLDFDKRPDDPYLLERLATAYEIAASEGLDALIHQTNQNGNIARQAMAGAFKAFEIRRVFAIPEEDVSRVLHILHIAALAYAGDRWSDLKRWILEHGRETEAPNVGRAPSWDRRVLFVIYDGWLRLFRKDSWNDLHGIAGLVVALRQEQARYEARLIGGENSLEKKAMALRLIALYHWARATELLSTYMLQGQPRGINQELDTHFEHGVRAASAAGDIHLEMLLRWLHVAARRMVAGSLWAATAGINTHVSHFVESLTSAARPLIELLPPQRSAMREQGLLDPASKAVVVDLPTSGGKTTLAQFRILQALNAFRQQGGWVAYVAPTRALVSQLTRRLRRDFGPIGIKVEQVSGGIEIDCFEAALLGDPQSFDVLISTPEKLGLIIRNDKLEHRPLALVVIDEAHNIEDQSRGLRLELLLATIQQDCRDANYLLMMPFVPDSASLARWLDPDTGGKPISLGTTAWQPNERIVGLFSQWTSEERVGRRKKWGLEFRTLTTTPRTIHLRGTHKAGDAFPLDLPVSEAASLSVQTAAMAKIFSSRGRTSIAVGDSPRTAWSMARAAAASMETPDRLPDEIKLVQDFLRTEVGRDFELIELLRKKVAVHHSGLPDEVRSLIEWLAEEGQLRVLCATTTIAQGINFPVSSVFLQRVEHPSQHGPIPMTAREFWNLAGRAGRVGQDSVGVVGIVTDNDPERTRNLTAFVAEQTHALASRLVDLIEKIVDRSPDAQLTAVIKDEEWADFRSFIAHLLREANDLQQLVSRTEPILRATLGFNTMKGNTDARSQQRAQVLLDVTNGYARRLAQNMGSLALADSTGFDPEGVQTAMRELRGLEHNLTPADWVPSSLFGEGRGLSSLFGVMMRIPALNQAINEIAGTGQDRRRVAEIAKAWVSGRSVQEIARAYFTGDDDTAKITDACRGISKALINNSVWGLAALSKLPGSGLDWENLSEGEQRQINLLPAFLYHGVDSEEAVLMRMNQVPRSVAKSLGETMRRANGTAREITVQEARQFIKDLRPDDWERLKPANAALTGSQYREVWQQLSGEAE
jgi:superfamily II DNA/RNA helicase